MFIVAVQLSCFKWEDVKLSIFIPSVYVFAVCFFLFQEDHALLSVKDYSLTINYNQNIIIRTMAGISGSIIVVYIAKWMYKLHSLNKYIERLGFLSLPIYVVHTQICDINQVIDLRFYNVIYVLVVSLLLVLISLTIYNISSRSKYLKTFLFGEVN